MIGYLEPVDLTNGGNEYMVLEFYAGAARLAKQVNALGGPATAMDRLYDADGDNKTQNNCMDFNTSGGFLFLSYGKNGSFRYLKLWGLTGFGFSLADLTCPRSQPSPSG